MLKTEISEDFAYWSESNNMRPRGKESTKVRITQKNRKRKGKLLLKNEEISGGKAHTNTQKLN